MPSQFSQMAFSANKCNWHSTVSTQTWLYLGKNKHKLQNIAIDIGEILHVEHIRISSKL